MSEEHAKRVAEIEAILADYAEVFEPPKYQPKFKAGAMLGDKEFTPNILPGAVTWVLLRHDEVHADLRQVT